MGVVNDMLDLHKTLMDEEKNEAVSKEQEKRRGFASQKEINEMKRREKEKMYARFFVKPKKKSKKTRKRERRERELRWNKIINSRRRDFFNLREFMDEENNEAVTHAMGDISAIQLNAR